jgi:hypothetical protein
MNTAAYQITRSSECHSVRSEVIATVESLEAGIAFLTKRAEANGFIVLAAEIEDGAASVCTAKPKTLLMNIYEIAEIAA